MARDNSTQEEGGVADFFEADGDAMETRQVFWSMSAEFIYRHHDMPRERLYVVEESSFPISSKYIKVVRQPKTTR